MPSDALPLALDEAQGRASCAGRAPRAVFLRSIPRARAPELVAALGTSYAPGARLSCDQDRNECNFAIFLWRGPVGLIFHGVHSLAEGEYR